MEVILFIQEALKLILYSASCAAAVTIFMAIVSTPEHIKDILERIMLVPSTMAAMLRDGCRSVLNKSWLLMQNSARSVGISGDHWIQRLVGMILLFGASILGFVVSTLNLIPVIGALFGSKAAENALNFLPVRLETLTSIELAIAALVFGIFLLDNIGITDITKFYSKSFLPKWLRYTLFSIFLTGTLYSIYLFINTGILRVDSVLSSAEASYVEIQEDDSTILINSNENNQQVEDINNMNRLKNNVTASDGSQYKTAITHLLIGIPTISTVAAIFSFIFIISFVGMLLTFPLFITISGIVGIFWMLGTTVVTIIDLLYNFALSFVNLFIEIGQSIRRSVSSLFKKEQQKLDRETQETPQNQNAEDTPEVREVADPGPDNNQYQNNEIPVNNPSVDQIPKEQIYNEDDPNWNPLL